MQSEYLNQFSLAQLDWRRTTSPGVAGSSLSMDGIGKKNIVKSPSKDRNNAN